MIMRKKKRYHNKRETIYPLQHHDVSAEKRLWAAVLLQAIKDSMGIRDGGYKGSCNKIKEEASYWLEKNSKDFTVVCEFAGVDPVTVKNKLIKSIT